MTKQDELNRLAGTTGLSIQQALNVLAGTTGRTAQDAAFIYSGAAAQPSTPTIQESLNYKKNGSFGSVEQIVDVLDDL
jgi:hypothetical protein